MHAWCLLDPKQNSTFIWSELINSPWNIREKRTVSWHRCCRAHIFLEEILFGSVCPQPAGHCGPTGLRRQGYQTWHLPLLHPDIPPVKVSKRTRHTGHQLSFPSDGREIKYHLFNASDTAMAVRVDTHLGGAFTATSGHFQHSDTCQTWTGARGTCEWMCCSVTPISLPEGSFLLFSTGRLLLIGPLHANKQSPITFPSSENNNAYFVPICQVYGVFWCGFSALFCGFLCVACCN